MRRFVQPQPNLLWQVDLIEEEETRLGKVYAVVVMDEHSRCLVILYFTLSKGQEEGLHALCQAFCSHGVPSSLLIGRGSQFYSALEKGKEDCFAEITERLGVEVLCTGRPQVKGKETLIQWQDAGLYRSGQPGHRPLFRPHLTGRFDVASLGRFDLNGTAASFRCPTAGLML